MRTFLFLITIVLLLLNGVGALYGSFHFIIHPDGSSLHMPLSNLEHAPFKDYLIPGIVLFFANGVLSFAVLCAILVRAHSYPVLLIIQGVILFGWIVIQSIMLRTVALLHVVYGSIGLCFMALGWYFYFRSRK
jgi:hypothetical protein